MGKRNKKEETNEKEEKKSTSKKKKDEAKEILTEDEEEYKWDAKEPTPASSDIISYITSVGSQLSQSFEELDYSESHNIGVPASEDVQLLVANVMSEISNQEAAVSCEKSTSKIIEHLLRLSDVEQTLRFLNNIRMQFGYLSYHALGSHVLETLFRVCAIHLRDHSLNNTPQGSELESLLIELAMQLESVEEWWPLMSDACGTHVARAFCMLMSGRIAPPRQQPGDRRPWPKYHQKSSKPSSSSSSSSTVAGSTSTGGENNKRNRKGNNHDVDDDGDNDSNDILFDTKETLFPYLLRILESLTKLEFSALVELSKNTYASPFLQMILKFSFPKKRAWKTLVLTLLEIPLNALEDKTLIAAAQKREGGVFQDLARDHVGSRLLDLILERCTDEIFELISRVHLVGKLAHLSKHRLGNFVVQKLFSRVRDETLFRTYLAELQPFIGDLVDIGHLGVLWKITEATRRISSLQDAINTVLQQEVIEILTTSIAKSEKEISEARQSLRNIGIAEILLWGYRGWSTKPHSNARNSISSKGLESAAAAAATAAAALGDNDEDDDDEKINNSNTSSTKHTAVSVSIPGAETLKSIIMLDPSVNRKIVESLIELSAQHLIALAMDPVGGRVVLEPLLDYGQNDLNTEASDAYGWAIRRIASKMKGHYGQLALDRFSVHFVRKLFQVGGGSVRLSIVQELVNTERALQGSIHGSRLLQICGVTQFKRHPEDWKESFERKQAKKKQMTNWLDTTFGNKKTETTEGATATSGSSRTSGRKIKTKAPPVIITNDSKSKKQKTKQ